MSTQVNLRFDDETLAAIDASGTDRASFVREAVEARLSGGASTAVELSEGTLKVLDGMIRGRAKGRVDRGLEPEPESRGDAIHRLLLDRASFSAREAVAVARLKAGSEPAA